MENAKIFSIFDEITKIPRESGKEEKIIQYLIDFAESRSLEYKKDEAGNVVILKPGSPSMENAPTVILQSHSDMVCEKNSDSDFNFDTDPIKYEEENGWLIAKETTLGADCGIGMAAQLAVIDSKTLKHGPIEALFTTEEETGLFGAKALKPGFIEGKILINLDSEDEGELFIGCAGGVDTTAKFHYNTEKVSNENNFIKISIYGATGGHSGDEIDKNRANANQILFRYLYQLSNTTDFALCSIDGGNKRNAIAREAYAVVAIPAEKRAAAEVLFLKTISGVKEEHSKSDPELAGSFESAAASNESIDKKTASKLIMAMHGVPHGVLAMSQEIEGLVETSTNLASIKMKEGSVIRIGTSQRSSIDSARFNAASRVEAIFKLAKAEVTHEGEYPGWKPRTDSPLLKISEQSYTTLFGAKPIVRAIHAGLECGMFLKTYPYLDMISFGPTIKGAHAPGERLEIASVDKFRKLLVDILGKIKAN
ncbi:MAG: aminoacyl-histidine dipeptidase [Bacteroidales bacterium]